jgi:hypothetical protein
VNLACPGRRDTFGRAMTIGLGAGGESLCESSARCVPPPPRVRSLDGPPLPASRTRAVWELFGNTSRKFVAPQCYGLAPVSRRRHHDSSGRPGSRASQIGRRLASGTRAGDKTEELHSKRELTANSAGMSGGGRCRRRVDALAGAGTASGRGRKWPSCWLIGGAPLYGRNCKTASAPARMRGLIRPTQPAGGHTSTGQKVHSSQDKRKSAGWAASAACECQSGPVRRRLLDRVLS